MKLLEALKAKGIARVEIAFDGAGDSGDIEGIACWSWCGCSRRPSKATRSRKTCWIAS